MTDITQPQLWRWRIVGPRRPRLTAAVTVAHATRAMLIRVAKRSTGSPILPFPLHGGAAARDGFHEHAFYLPDDLDLDGIIDHITVCAPCGFDEESLRLLGSATTLELRLQSSRQSLELVTVNVGNRDEEPSIRWQSLTPFVAPVRKKPLPERTAKGVLEQLIASRLDERRGRLPAAVIRLMNEGVLGKTLRDPGDFTLGKRFPRGEEAADPLSGWFEITFASPVAGPLAFGFQEHFGLGRFVPVS